MEAGEPDTEQRQPLLQPLNGCALHADDAIYQEERIGGSGFLHTLFNSVNVLCGVGLLTTPYAAAKMGWLSILLLFGLGVLFLYTGKLLGRCMEKAPWVLTYADIGELAFGIKGRIIIAILLYSELYLTAVDFLIMEGDNLEALAPNFRPFGGRLGSAKQSWVLVAAAIMLPAVYLRDLSALAYLSAAGVFASLGLTGLVGWEGAQLGFPNTNLPLLRVAGVPLSIGILSFNFGGHSLFPSLYTAMKQPKHYSRVLDFCFAIVFLLYAAMAVLGYFTFGETVEDNVTLSMQHRQPHAIATNVATWITIISPFTKYPLVLSPIAAAIEELIPATHPHLTFKPLPGGPGEGHILQRTRKGGLAALAASLGIRTALVCSTVAVALTVPMFGYMMAFIGALFGLLACVVVPALCYLQLSKGQILRSELHAVSLTAILGVMLCIVGTANAALSIVNAL